MINTVTWSVKVQTWYSHDHDLGEGYDETIMISMDQKASLQNFSQHGDLVDEYLSEGTTNMLQQ